MRAVVQRCRAAEVAVAGRVVAAIACGLCAFVAAGRDDGADDVAYIAQKLQGLRVFPEMRPPGDGPGPAAAPAGQPEGGPAPPSPRMLRSLAEVRGALLLVPQFTLYGDVRRGRRPDFTAAAAPEPGRALLAALAARLRTSGLAVEEGVFGADMEVRVANWGPVTILLDSRRTF
jgi:D-tyrosyl-tRNA(Tyr) deacylase